LDGNSEETQVIIQQLGNLTILTNSDNSRIQNFPFDDKKVVYKEENLKINALVVESSQWGKDEIAARQQKLSEHILALWPRR
jgi:hypothetical protein